MINYILNLDNMVLLAFSYITTVTSSISCVLTIIGLYYVWFLTINTIKEILINKEIIIIKFKKRKNSNKKIFNFIK